MMVYEFRTYIAPPGKLPSLLARFRDHTLRLFEKHGIVNVGYWTSEVEQEKDHLFYLVRFEDHVKREAAWDAFQADPDWQAIRASTNKGGSLVKEMHVQVMNPTDFSLLK